jgi:hypothetical protein
MMGIERMIAVDRRIARVKISLELLLGGIGLPEGTRVRFAEFNADENLLELSIEHAALRPVEDDSMPIICPKFRRVCGGWHDFLDWGYDDED